jgi:hypothetical protein
MAERDRPGSAEGDIIDDDIVIVSPEMIRAGVGALVSESYGTPQEDLAGLIYMAMEYQRRREAASLTNS